MDIVIIVNCATSDIQNYIGSCQEWSGICDWATRDCAMKYELDYAIRLIKMLERKNKTLRLNYEWV